jgi:TonB-linked SusC/RagA family outer membrane protein
MMKIKKALLLALFVLFGASFAFGQRTVTGTVTDHVTGETLPFVAVQLKGTGTGTATSPNGVFTITVPSPESVLVFSFIGYETLELPANADGAMTVRLKPSSTVLQGVVITGMFDRPKESNTGVAVEIRGAELQASRGQNLLRTIGNIDPSINILSDNLLGSDPNAIPDITIRGRSSLPMNVQELNEEQRYSINTPLIIMDGFEIRLQRLMDFNDDEIESITILKDASATAVYGSRGANGVIVVTTKQPQPGQLRINLRLNTELELPDLSSYDLLNADEKLQLEWDNGFYSHQTPQSDLALKERYNRRLRDVLAGVNTHWMSKPLRAGITQRYNLRLDGGTQEFRWGVALGYSRVEGVMKGSGRDNFSGSSTLQYNYKSLVFRNQTEIGTNKGMSSNYGSFSQYSRMNPYYRPYNDNGRLIENFESIGGSDIANPLYNATLASFNENGYKQISNNFSIEWTIAEGLTLRGRLGLSLDNNTSDDFVSPLHSTFLSDPYYLYGDGMLERGIYDYKTGENSSYDANLTLGYTKKFNEKHQLYTGFNYSMLQRKSFMYGFRVVGFNDENLPSIGTAMRYPQSGKPAETDQFTRSVGFTGNVNYTYDNRYFADLALRADGSSQFGANNRFAPFYSLGAGWNLHREDFLKNHAVINSLRLKASYGQTGSQAFDAFLAMRTFEYSLTERYANWGIAYLRGFGNDELKWQVTTQYNIGSEISLFNNRLNAAIDIYEKRTSNLLSTIEVVHATGFSNYIANVGEVKNAGFEASLGGAIIRRTDFSWSMNGKIAHNRDEIVKLSKEVQRQTEEYLLEGKDVSNLFYVGRSQNSLYCVRSLGIDPSTGQEVFLDKNGNVVHVWAPSDKVYAGVAEPLFRGNISTRLVYKNFTFNLSFGYHWGGVAYNQTLINRVEMRRSEVAGQNLDRRVLTERWNKPGDIVSYKKIPTASEPDITTRATTRFVMKDQVFHLQAASIEYHFVGDWVRKAGFQNARLAMNTSDLFYISSIKRERGLEYPFARRIGATITLMF